MIYTLHFLTLLVFFIKFCSLQEAIQYLFPSGLFDKSSRPKFKVTISFRQLFNNWINWSILDRLLDKTEKSLFYHFQFPWYIVFNKVSDSVIFRHMFSYCWLNGFILTFIKRRFAVYSLYTCNLNIMLGIAYCSLIDV